MSNNENTKQINTVLLIINMFLYLFPLAASATDTLES